MTTEEHIKLLEDLIFAGYLKASAIKLVNDTRWLVRIYDNAAVNMFYNADRTPLSERLRIGMRVAREEASKI